MRVTLYRHPKTIEEWLYKDEALRMTSISIGGLIGLFSTQFLITQSNYFGVLIEFFIILLLSLLADRIVTEDENLPDRIRDACIKSGCDKTFTNWSLRKLTTPKEKILKYSSLGAAAGITSGIFLISLDVLGFNFPLLMLSILTIFFVCFIVVSFVQLDEECELIPEEIEEGIVE